MIRMLLLASLALVGYALLVLGRPLIRCPRCLGKRMLHREGAKGHARALKCPFCDATGIFRMPGATTVHHFFWLVFGDHLRERRRQDVAQRTGQQPPSPPRKDRAS